LGNHAQVAADTIQKWHGSKVSCHVDMDDQMTNNFEIFVQGKNQTYLVHSRMKKNHKLFKEESPEHLDLVKKAMLDIIMGKEPTLPESRKKKDEPDKKSKAQMEEEAKAAAEEAKAAAEEKKQKMEETKQKREELVKKRTATKELEPTSAAAPQDKADTNDGKEKPKTKRLSAKATEGGKAAKEQRSPVDEKSEKPPAKAKTKTKAKAKAKTYPQVVKPEAQLDSTTASTAASDRFSEAKAGAPTNSDKVDSLASTTASEDSLEAKAETLAKLEDMEVGEAEAQAKPDKEDTGIASTTTSEKARFHEAFAGTIEASTAASEEVRSPVSSTGAIEAVIVEARIEKQEEANNQEPAVREEPIVEQEIARFKAPVQSVAEASFFGFLCCRGSKVEDRCVKDDGDDTAQQVVEQELCLSKS